MRPFCLVSNALPCDIITEDLKWRLYKGRLLGSLNTIRDALRNAISEGILSWSLGPLGDQGVLSSTPPGSPKLPPKEIGYASPGGILYTGPGGLPYIKPGCLWDATPEPSWICFPPRPRCRAFSEPPVSPARFTFTQRCAPPQQQSVSRPDTKPCGSQRAVLTQGPPRTRTPRHHVGSSSGLGPTWFNAYRLTRLNACRPNTRQLNACRLIWDPGIRY